MTFDEILMGKSGLDPETERQIIEVVEDALATFATMIISGAGIRYHDPFRGERVGIVLNQTRPDTWTVHWFDDGPDYHVSLGLLIDPHIGPRLRPFVPELRVAADVILPGTAHEPPTMRTLAEAV